MRVDRWAFNKGEMEVVYRGDYVNYDDYVKLYETAQRLADALDNMPILSEGHLKVKDKALNEFYDDTLAP
jgi:hypothetical protein